MEFGILLESNTTSSCKFGSDTMGLYSDAFGTFCATNLCSGFIKGPLRQAYWDLFYFLWCALSLQPFILYACMK